MTDFFQGAGIVSIFWAAVVLALWLKARHWYDRGYIDGWRARRQRG
jgi:hypothetical protein